MASTTNSDCYAAVDIGASSGRVVIGTVNEAILNSLKFTASTIFKSVSMVMIAGISICYSAKL